MSAGAVLRCAIAAAIAAAAGCSASPAPGSTGGGGQNQGTGGHSSETDGTGGVSPDAGLAPDTAAPAGSDAPSVQSDVTPSGGLDAAAGEGGSNSDAGGKPAPVRSAGCGGAGQLPEGAGTLPSGRRYLIRLPAGYDANKPFPLVFALHYNDGNIGEFDDQGTRAAMRDWAILVLTQSQTSDWRQAFPADLAYFDALVALVKDKLCVDTGRMFAFGFSGGASFSSLLACKRDFMRAFGACGGIPGYDGYTAADCKPMPAWIDQGARTGMVELWTAKNGCTQPIPGVRPNCQQYVCSTAPVIYCTNGAHAWPSYGSADVAAFFKQF